jgi:hypothetical protein
MNDDDLREERAKTPALAKPLIGSGHEQEPLRHYLVFMGTFLTTVSLGVRWARRSDRPFVTPGFADLVLLGLATNRLSRLITREKVTRVLRAPFTEVDDDAAPEEVKEHPRGTGLTRGFGELLTCPRCVAMWAAAAMSVLYLRSPFIARFAGTVLSAAALSDYVNTRYASGRVR